MGDHATAFDVYTGIGLGVVLFGMSLWVDFLWIFGSEATVLTLF